MRFSRGVLGVVWLIFGITQATAAKQYQRSVDVNAVRLSYDEFQTLLEKLRSLIRAADSGIPDADLRPSESLDLSHKGITVSFDTSFSADDLARGPAIASSVRYAFSVFRPAPISRAVLTFDDYKRSLEVVGSDPNQVDAVVAAFQEAISGSTTWWGGTSARFWMAMMMIVGGFGIAYVAATFVSHWRRQGLTIAVVGISVMVTGFAFPYWPDLFPGALIHRYDVSFWVQHAALISLVGTIGTLVGLVVSLIRRKPTPQTPVPESTP
jgi:hypothetical protein